MGNSTFSSLFCGFRFTFCIEDEIFFTDNHVFFQKLSGQIQEMKLSDDKERSEL